MGTAKKRKYIGIILVVLSLIIVSILFVTNDVLHNKRVVSKPQNELNQAEVHSELYEKVKAYLEREFERVYTPYYEVLDLKIWDWKENGNEATFFYTMIHKNYDRDPDTVAYIKEAKENGSPSYEQLKKEYLEPKEANYQFKAVLEKNEIALYYNQSPNGIQWAPVTIEDFLLQ